MLGRFLRDRRARITLAEAGLPGRRAGRVATLTQEDLARLTGFSVRTISGLEQGTEHRPSPELLDAVAAALRLGPEERRTLWQLAVRSLPPDSGYTPEPDPHLARMTDLLEPHPSYVCDAIYNVHKHNRAFADWVHDFSSAPPEQRNLARYLILERHARHLLPDWRRELVLLAARIRAVRSQLPDDEELELLIADLSNDPDFHRTWHDGADVGIYGTNTALVMREPGFTDPDQPDDRSHHVALVMTALTPMTANDNRRFMTFLLPEGYRRSEGGSPCGPCLRGD